MSACDPVVLRKEVLGRVLLHLGSRLHPAPGNLEHHSGPSRGIEELIKRSQSLMNESLRGVLEEIRRNEMRASMALVWCFNEPWPNAAGCGNVVTWSNTPTPALRYVALGFRPVLASARIRKLAWRPGEEFAPELWMLSDAPSATPAGRVEAWLKIGEEETFLQAGQHRRVPFHRTQEVWPVATSGCREAMCCAA